MIKRISKNIILLTAILIVGGCATQIAPNASAFHKKEISKTKTFFSGRFSVRYFNEAKERRNAYGNFNFTNIANNTNIVLRSPLGITLATVTLSEENASLQLPGKPIISAADVDWLMVKTLGFALPLEGLKYWLNGIPSLKSDATNQNYNHIGQLIEMEQDNWKIIFDYKKNYLNKIELSWKIHNETEMPLKIKLILNHTISSKKMINFIF